MIVPHCGRAQSPA